MRYPTSNASLRAPRSQFRVVTVDVDETSGTYVLGDFSSLDAANQAAIVRAGIGAPVYIYDDRGELLARLGSWH